MKCASDADLARSLASWYAVNARTLPFRLTRDPYRIWISEVMLQQTRVAAMLPAYERFLERFPDVASLAAAEEEEVLHRWQGLGYYSRARNLHRAAMCVCESHGTSAAFPDSYEALRRLPGIGPYTAAAVASICSDETVAVVDGNVRRVLGRLRGVDGADPRRMQRLADELLVSGGLAPSLHNQAMMEVGALLCLPRNPRCETCPLSAGCAAQHEGLSALSTAQPRTSSSKVRLDLDVQIHYSVGAEEMGEGHMGEGEIGHEAEIRILLIPNTESLFLKKHMFFPHRIRSEGGELLRTKGFRARSRPVGEPFRHAIMNWEMHVQVQLILHDRARPATWAAWMTEEEARRSLVSSLAVKVLDRGFAALRISA